MKNFYYLKYGLTCCICNGNINGNIIENIYSNSYSDTLSYECLNCKILYFFYCNDTFAIYFEGINSIYKYIKRTHTEEEFVNFIIKYKKNLIFE